MQSVVPALSSRNPNSHTEAEILDALQGRHGSRRFGFRYELLDSAGTIIGDLTNVLGGKIDQNWLADIKRKATFKMREVGGINYLSDRIRPYVRVGVSPYGTNDWVEYPQGVFLLSSPKRGADPQLRVTRDVEAYDLLQVFSDDLVSARYTIAAAANVTTAIVTLLGSILQRVSPSASTLPTAKEWDPGTSKLRIINDLLNTINYESLSFDEDGYAVVQPYVAASSRADEYRYETDTRGLIVPQAEQELDLFRIANKWVLVVSDPDRAELIASYTNADPASPTSTIRRGRTITDYRTEQDATDLTTLQQKAARLAFEASQIYEAIDFQTAMMPIHSGNDVYHLTYEPLAINARYTEQSWSMELRAGAKMAHRARRVVTV